MMTVLYILIATAFAADLGVVTLVEGTVETQKGKLEFIELLPGGSVKVNAFSQYRGSESEKKARVVWTEGAKRSPLDFGQVVPFGEIIETKDMSWVRLVLPDDSIIDLGPHTLFQIEKFEMGDKERHILLRLLSGKARILVVRKLEGRSTFAVTTPGVLASVRGTDFIVHTDISGDRAKTSVIGVRGQVTCDLARNTKRGEVYHQSVIVNTYSHLTVESTEGYAQSYDLEDKLSMPQYSQALETHAPLTDPMISMFGAHPHPSMLPGTAYKRPIYKAQPKAPPHQGLAEELAAEHPVTTDASGDTVSANFEAPKGLERDENAVNRKAAPYISELGANRVDRLPYERLRLAAPSMVPVRP